MNTIQKLNPHTALTRETGFNSDYILNPNHGRVWIQAGDFSVRVMLTDEGIIVDVWGDGQEDTEPMASTYAFTNDIVKGELI